MNIVIFASDSKGKAVLQNVVKAIRDEYSEKINFLFMFSNETQLQYPQMGTETFRIDCDETTLSNMNKPMIFSDSLNLHLPWKPDILIIQRERWQPEQSIIAEFKTKWNAKIGVIEVNSQIINHIESQLEMGSRFRYPQQMVDFYFEGSDWTVTNRKMLLGDEWDKSIVVGNPRFDVEHKYKQENLSQICDKYTLDERKIIIFWSIINTSRNESLECLKNLTKRIDNTKYRILFKPYPGEPLNERFRHQFNGNKLIYNNEIIENLTIIYDDKDIFELTELSDIHITGLSSTFLFPLSHRKNIVNLHSKVKFIDYMNDVNRYTNETNIGVEDSSKFWMSVYNLESKEKFCNLVETFNIDSWKERNEIILKDVIEKTYNYDDELKFLEQIDNDEIPLQIQSELINYFDSFYDGNSTHRIIKHLIREFY